MLYPVKLNKTDTCLTYCLRRIGKDDLINKCNYETIHDYFESTIFTPKRELQVGDLLYWYRDSKLVDLPWEIDQEGKILWHRKIIGSHVAVYEGNGVISDNTRMIQPPHPTIRARRLADLNKMPDYIMRPIKNGEK